MLQSATKCYRVLQGITGYYKVLQSITKTNLAHLLGPLFGLVFILFGAKREKHSLKSILANKIEFGNRKTVKKPI